MQSTANAAAAAAVALTSTHQPAPCARARSTFFVACLALDARREDRALRGRGYAGCAWCCTNTKDYEASPLPAAPAKQLDEQGAHTVPAAQGADRGVAKGAEGHDLWASSGGGAGGVDVTTPLCVPTCWGPQRFDPAVGVA